MSRSVRAHIILFCVVAVWGSTFVLVKDALRDISPLLFNLLRMGLAFLCLAVAYRRQWKHIRPAGWKSGAVLGLILAIAYQFQTSGLNLTTPSKSAFLTGLTLVLVPLLAALPGVRRRGTQSPPWNVWSGVLLAFVGVALLAAPAKAGGGIFMFADLSGIGAGDLLTLGCAFAFTCHIIFQDRVSEKERGQHENAAPAETGGLQTVPFEQLALLQLGFCTLVMAVSMPLLEKPHLRLTGLVVITLLVEAVLATAVAFTVQSWVQQFLAPTYLVLIYAMEPVFAWLTSLAFLHQGLSARAGCGALLILAGVMTAELIDRKPNLIENPASD
jgi:drug/metabolite transporter (DMT)-like permease